MSMLKHFIMTTASLGLLLLTACGNSYGDRCAAAIQCSGGNDRDVDACIAKADGAENVAAAYDCSDAYFKLVDCVDNTSTCRDKHFENNCKDQSDALNTCVDAASGQ
jgi:hypothetical protein